MRVCFVQKLGTRQSIFVRLSLKMRIEYFLNSRILPKSNFQKISFCSRLEVNFQIGYNVVKIGS